MLLGVLDLSFLASEDFENLLEKSRDISFAMYSPLAWKLGYTQYGFSKEWDEYPIEYIEPFLRERLARVENSRIHLIRRNLRIGIDQSRILLIRNVFFKSYWQLHRILDIKNKDNEAIAVRDLSNLLLASQLRLPLWTEKNAESWIKKMYHFKLGKKSELIKLPFTSENPKNCLRDALNKLTFLFNQGVEFEEIIRQLKEDLKKTVKIAISLKGIVLSTFEPLPIWEKLDLTYRILSSAILTIIDTIAMKEHVKFSS